MSVWFAIPTADPVRCGETFAVWKARGYRTAALTDGPEKGAVGNADLVRHVRTYPGYAAAVNDLARHVLDLDPAAEWVVTGGDDVYPDMSETPEHVAAQCAAHFGGTLGVMECTGDRWQENDQGLCAAERVCVAPWLGRAWCRRAYGGRGPLCEDYAHFFVDEDLKNVAERLGLLWHRRDLTQFHRHWSRYGLPRPAYLNKAADGWAAARDLFIRRRDAGFPGHELAEAPCD